MLFKSPTVNSADKLLLESLGINPPELIEREDTRMGIINFSAGGSIEIFCSAYPATFWKFKIETTEGNKFICGTGSGSLRDYWKVALMIKDGLLVVDRT